MYFYFSAFVETKHSLTKDNAISLNNLWCMNKFSEWSHVDKKISLHKRAYMSYNYFMKTPTFKTWECTYQCCETRWSVF